MVLAIAALFVHLHAAAAVSQPLSHSSETSAAVASTASPDCTASSPSSTPSSKDNKSVLLASNTGLQLANPDDSGAGNSSDPRLSQTSFASLVRNSQSLSDIRVVTPESKALRFVEPESLPSRRRWLALAIAEHAAATFDAYSTRQAISRGAFEADPMMRPFAQSPAIYAAIQVAPVALDFAARHMQRSQNGFLRRTWWLPQSAAAGMFLFSGVHNIHVANQLH